MKRELKILILAFIVFSITRCSTTKDNLLDVKALKIAIAESIQIPFKESDTVIYNPSLLMICGNSSGEELRSFYEPHLEEQPYAEILVKNHKEKIWFRKDELHKLMDSVYGEKRESETFWNSFNKNKISFYVSGKINSNKAIDIHEIYILNDKIHAIQKDFTFEKGKWTYQITENKLIE